MQRVMGGETGRWTGDECTGRDAGWLAGGTREEHAPERPALVRAKAPLVLSPTGRWSRHNIVWLCTNCAITSLPPGLPWCAAFVHHVGRSAHCDQLTRRSSWPLPATGSCEALARAARARGVLRDEPYVGDIFLLYNRLRRRFIHTGIVVGVQAEERVHERDVHVCLTVERQHQRQRLQQRARDAFDGRRWCRGRWRSERQRERRTGSPWETVPTCAMCSVPVHEVPAALEARPRLRTGTGFLAALPQWSSRATVADSAADDAAMTVRRERVGHAHKG